MNLIDERWKRLTLQTLRRIFSKPSARHGGIGLEGGLQGAGPARPPRRKSWMMALDRRVLSRLPRGLVVAGALLLAALSVVLRLVQGPEPRVRPEAAEFAPAAAEPFTVTACDTVRRGDTFSSLLLRNRVSVQDIGRILERNRELQFFSPRQLRPGQVLNVTRDEYGRFDRLRIEISPEEIYIFEAKDDSLLAYPEDIDRELRLRKLAGEIHSTFDEAVLAAGGDLKLALRMADLFEYDVDFCTEVQRGDHFNLLVEERFANGRFLGFGEVLYGEYLGSQANSEAVYFKPDAARKGGHYDREGKALKKSFLKSPLNYRRISSTYAAKRFHPILKKWRPHHGVDYAAAAGTPVVAIADGTIEQAGWRGGYGRVIEIQHRGKIETLYGHLSRFANGIRGGSSVRQGQVVGYVGMSGLATGPHLHFEMRQNGDRIDPMTLKNIPAEPIEPGAMDRFHEWTQELADLDSALHPGQVIERFDPRELRQALAVAVTGGEPTALR